VAGKKSGNGHELATVRMVEVLERIEAGMTDLRSEMRGVRGELGAIHGRIAHLIEVSGTV